MTWFPLRVPLRLSAPVAGLRVPLRLAWYVCSQYICPLIPLQDTLRGPPWPLPVSVPLTAPDGLRVRFRLPPVCGARVKLQPPPSCWFRVKPPIDWQDSYRPERGQID